MLNGNLLISNGGTMVIIILCLCVFAVASILYGVFRKFSQMGWLPWQLPIFFAFGLLADSLTAPLQNDYGRYIAAMAIFVTGVVLIFAVGALIRYFMHTKMRPALLIWRVFDRLLGAITALLGFVMILLAVGGLVLPFLEYVLPEAGGILGIFDLNIWAALGPYALDFFVVTLLACSLQAGYRIGLGRALIYGIMIVLTAGSIFLSVYLTLFTSPFRAFARLIARGFSGLNPMLASFLGYGIATLLEFIVFFLVSCLIGFFLNKLLRRIRYVRVLGIIDGILFAVVFLVLACGLISGIHFGISYLAGGNFEAALGGNEQIGQLLESVRSWGSKLEAFVMSSPLSRLLYLSNPLRLVLPA